MLELLQWLRCAIHIMSWNNERICFREAETWKHRSCILKVQIFLLKLLCIQGLFLRNKFFSQLCCMFVIATCLRCELFKKALSTLKSTGFWGLGMCFLFTFWNTEATRCLAPKKETGIWQFCQLQKTCVYAQPSQVYEQTGRRQKAKFYTGGLVPPKSVGLLSLPTARICPPAYQQPTASRKSMQIFAQTHRYKYVLHLNKLQSQKKPSCILK